LPWGLYSCECAFFKPPQHLERIMTADIPVTDTAIIGSGFIGRAWAISFARAGARVRMWDQAAEQTAGALAYIGGLLEDLARNDLLNGKTPQSVLSLISIASSMTEALAEATYVQENTPDVLPTKIRFSRRWTERRGLTRFWRVQPRRYCRRALRKISRAGGAASWCIRSIRPI
jgi:2-polyprenyl-6-methoxyphenol hydroxylase-like FAD-dependent oxidoreductase